MNYTLKEQMDLAEMIGKFMKHWSFKAIHGKIWTLLYMSSEPRDAAYFIENLNVTKGLVSLAIKDLLQHNVIFKVDYDKNPNQSYIANAKIIGVITDVLRQRELKMLYHISTAHSILTKTPQEKLNQAKVDIEKLEDLEALIELGKRSLEKVIQFENLQMTDWNQWEG